MHTSKKDWTEIKTNDSWAIFKIMAEFVEAFERMSKIGPCVSIFGSARTKSENKYYSIALDISQQLSKLGYGIISGGGPGIMEAANQGAKIVGSPSVGLNIDLPFEQNHNQYIDPEHNLEFDYFFVRKVIFVKYSQAFVIMPGGLGTLDELFEAMTLIQTNKINKRPIVLVGKSYWEGLLSWMKHTMLEEQKNISLADLEIFTLVETADEAVNYIDNFYKSNELTPNF